MFRRRYRPLQGPRPRQCLLAALWLGFAGMAQAAPELADGTQTGPAVPTQTLFIGTWTGGAPAGLGAAPTAYPSEGIYRVRLNGDGSLAVLDVAKLANPSWLVFSRDGRFVYTTNEDNGDAPGHVSALARQADGSLKKLNEADSHGQQPTHAQLSPDGRFLFVANYSARPAHAGVAVFAIAKDGSIGAQVQDIPYLKGDGALPDRQADGHAHSVTFTPDGRMAYAADLGSDVMRAYRYRPDASAPLSPQPADDVHFPPGSGPRHLLFSADGRHAYATTEMGAQVVAFRVDGDRLSELERLDLTEDRQASARGGAGMMFSPDGKFLYVGNRRETNQIVAYAVDPDSGRLRLVGRYPSGGKEPRAFAIDVSGRYLLVANVFSNNVVEFRRDPQTGVLQPTGVALQLGLPTDVKFQP